MHPNTHVYVTLSPGPLKLGIYWNFHGEWVIPSYFSKYNISTEADQEQKAYIKIYAGLMFFASSRYTTQIFKIHNDMMSAWVFFAVFNYLLISLLLCRLK